MKYYRIENALQGVILGTAVGDSLGLPAEGLSPKRLEALSWKNWRHRFFFGKGMISDDTEHTLFVAQAMLQYPENAERFQKALAKKLRWWLVSLPAGTGMATARAILKLWCGCSPRKSGVFSAGNGPAMRAAIIGAFFAEDEQRLSEYVKASTELTHSDPKAYTGSLAVALLAAEISRSGKVPEVSKALYMLRNLECRDDEWLGLVDKMQKALTAKIKLKEFCRQLNLENGVSGYMYHSVPVVLYALFWNEGRFKEALEDVLNCGGDADTTGAILGSILGAQGKDVKIPESWVSGIIEWPRSVKFMNRVSEQMMQYKEGQNYRNVTYFLPFILIRNLFFLGVVLTHGFMRLLPAFLVRRICP